MIIQLRAAASGIKLIQPRNISSNSCKAILAQGVMEALSIRPLATLILNLGITPSQILKYMTVANEIDPSHLIGSINQDDLVAAVTTSKQIKLRKDVKRDEIIRSFPQNSADKTAAELRHWTKTVTINAKF